MEKQLASSRPWGIEWWYITTKYHGVLRRSRKPDIVAITEWTAWERRHFEGILPKGPYLPCVSMAGRALLAGYHRLYRNTGHIVRVKLYSVDFDWLYCYHFGIGFYHDIFVYKKNVNIKHLEISFKTDFVSNLPIVEAMIFNMNTTKDSPVAITVLLPHDDVIKWKHFPRYWPFVRGIHRSTVNSPHKGQWRGALIFSLICARINGWVNNRDASNLRRHRAHYDVIVMTVCGDGSQESTVVECMFWNA